jgi:alginate O-acetyltransferase complex protein AlgI
MTFGSPGFLFIFLPLCVLGFQLFGLLGRRGTIGFLALMSFVFYAQWSTQYLFLLVGSILFNFCVSHLIFRAKGRERLQTGWLVFGIASNLLALVYFKYLFPLLGFITHEGLLHHDFGSVILPLGISFFTFTQIAYLIDLKQGVAQPESPLSYSLFVTFFPHLIAGPILHHKEIMPQFREERRYKVNSDDMAVGLTWFTMGLFKKLIVADRIAPFADVMFANPGASSFVRTWLAVLTYAMQLYFDFSGYSDMAVGLARMFSIRFPLNFNSPYKATSIIDFWNRWHMTLTRYIMAYVYSPLLFWISRRRQENGKKVSKRAQATLEGFTHMIAFPTIFTLFLAGIWHGAGFQYLVYGLMHGCYITINHLWRTFVPHDGRLRKLMTAPVAVLITFVPVLFGEVMFRAGGFHHALTVYADMLGRHGFILHEGLSGQAAIILGLLAVVWLMPNTQEILGEEQKEDDPNWSFFRIPRWTPNLAWGILSIAAFLLSMGYSSAASTFLYFQF